ncbi:phage tail family protein [Erysipelothrix rhusiopathiae]|nr:phage tail family protein [Erysipelothrix rhusiopathiae]MDE8339803.1 phage tail family protein [Erysipelothrix rhusiopathiae]
MMKFNNLSEKELGILIEEPTKILGRAPLRFEQIEIEGKDGSERIPLGYSSLPISLEVQIINPSKTDRLLATLVEKIKVEYQGRYTFADIYDALNIERFVTMQRFTLSLEREPFWYVDDRYTTNSTNLGTVFSRPLIRLTKVQSSDVEISINGIRLSYRFGDQEHEVIIDCNRKICTYKGLNRNRNLKIGWDFPILKSGNNEVRFHKGMCIVEFKRKDRWL